MLTYDYSVIPGEKLDAALAKELSGVFSSSYGRWSRKSPVNPGGPIRLGARYYLENYAKRPFRIAICRVAGRLAAQAIYLEKNTSRGKVSLVVQLVVEPRFRRQGVATALLHATWGFSDHYAWGIVTSSPCTVEALEAATFRRCRASAIAKEAAFIRRTVLSGVPFLKTAAWSIDGKASVVDTGFFTDRSAMPVARRRVESRLGRMPEGAEWMAFTFRSQPLDLEDAYSQVIGCSGKFVRQAYRRQPQSRQKWAGKTNTEIDNLLRWLPEAGKATPICDFGAGTGRHIAELKRRGFSHVDGIDFAPTAESRRGGVAEADCRSWRSSRRYGLILCLYDVIGSFADDRANLAILKNIARHLSAGGYAVVSVANAEFSGLRDARRVDSSDRSAFLKSVFALRPSRVMSGSGEFLDSHTTLRDAKRGVFFHKEQFDGGTELPGEYLIADRRYTAGEIEGLVGKAGLKVVMRRYVRAGFSRSLGRDDGKEILVVARKQISKRKKGTKK